MLSPNNNKYLKVTFIIIAIVAIAAVALFLFFFQKKKKPPVDNTAINPVAVTGNLVPTDTKNPTTFIEKVQDKSAEMQKNYDANLTEFASKRWERLLREQNNDNISDWGENLKILSQEIQKTDDQSTLFKVKYRIKNGDTEREMEDYYYLILSDTKRIELGMNNLKSNVFLSEEDIKKNITRENFAKIGKIKN